MDLRGSGDSGKPTAKDSYDLDHMIGDIIAVADAAGAKRFHVWGFGHGGTIARYLPARSDRVASAVLVGMTMGPAVTGVFKTAIEAMRAKWQPVIDAQVGRHARFGEAVRERSQGLGGRHRAQRDAVVGNGELPAARTDRDQGADDVGRRIGRFGRGEPEGGTEPKLKGTQVTGKTLSSVNYSDSFTKIDQIMQELGEFLKKMVPTT